MHQPHPVSQYLTLAGGKIAFDDLGRGPLVICVPGLGDVRAEYRFLRPHLLAAGCRVVTTDLRGAGESSASFAEYTSRAIGADVVALVRQFGAGSATLIGTSMAANSAAWAALQAPELVQGLVLIGGFVRAHAANTLLKPLMNVLFATRPWGPALWTRYWGSLFPSRKPADFDAYRAHLKKNLSEPDRLEALKAMLNRPDADAAGSRLSGVTTPALVVMGTHDSDFKDPKGEAQWIADQLHGSVVLVDGAGHYPHVEMPERVGPEIVRFLLATATAHAA